LAAIPSNNTDPFKALEDDWALVCRQHRRSGVIQRWVAQEPDLAGLRQLADVIPPPGENRTRITAAVTRLHIAGDDTASRTLLQLLVPGMIQLTARWRHKFPGGAIEAAWEVITRAGIYIARLRHRHIRCAPAGYILTSLNRDLLHEAQHEDTHVRLHVPWDDHPDNGSQLAGPSAEDVLSSGPLVRQALDDAVNAGALTPDTAELLWHVLSGDTVTEAAAKTSTPTPTAYTRVARAAAVLARKLHTSTDRGNGR
jgi:hypothetical protein